MSFGPYEVVDSTLDYGYDIAFCSICQTAADLSASQKQAAITGISFAHCGDIVFQVVQCHEPGCRGRFVFRSNSESPALDMRELIMMPVIDSPFIHCEEQAELLINQSKWSPKLNFKYIPAWDENHITKEEFIRHPSCQANQKSILRQFGSIEENHLEYFSENDIFEILGKEIKVKKFLLRKFFPNTSLFNTLLTCLAPKQQTSLELQPYPPTPEKQNKDKHEAFLGLLKHYYGQDIYECIQTKLEENILLSKTNFKDIKLEVDRIIYFKLHTTANDLNLVYEKMLKNDYMEVESLFKTYFEKIYHPICTARFLTKHRKELEQWTKKAKQNTALFVDAPMGLGKTYSIAQGLASNPNFSAVIFMPTKRLCLELRDELAKAISDNEKKYPQSDDIIPVWLFDAELMKFDDNGDMIDQFKEEYYLDRGIYLFDGINKAECIKYEKILYRYDFGYYRKKDICNECEKIKTCRFLKHKDNLPNYRIIITTHFMYDLFYHNSSFRQWVNPLKQKRGEEKPNEKRKKKPEKKVTLSLRDYFIIDEDFILSNCYKPVAMNEKKLSAFVLALTTFFNDPDFFEDKQVSKKYYINNDLIIGRAGKAIESSVIPPIDPNFKYPKFIRETWQKSIKEQRELIPDELVRAYSKQHPFYAGDYLDILEQAIKKGFVVQVYKPQDSKTEIKTILLPNPKQYSFRNKKFPAHVFFDGTKLENQYIKKKIKGLLIKSLEIKMKKLPWEMKVWQNINTDLPKSKTKDDRKKIEQVITKIIDTHGPYGRYFILTNKNLKEKIESFFQKKFPGVNHVIEYYGNLRGVNTAKRCNVGIILGSLILPDTAEISMSFDFIYENFISSPPLPVPTFGNIWSWRWVMGSKKYKDKFSEVEKFSKTYRFAEYRQALARTRYISHPVTFYIFSKDKIDSYEPFVNKSNIESFQYSSELFPLSKIRHKKNKYEDIKEVVYDWLKRNPYITITDIVNNYPMEGFIRQTVGKHLKEMMDNGILEYYIKVNKKSSIKYKKRYKIKIIDIVCI